MHTTAMPMTLDQIVEESRQWPDDVVAELVDRLMLARHGVDNPALSPAWQSVLARRVEEIRSGNVPPSVLDNKPFVRQIGET